VPIIQTLTADSAAEDEDSPRTHDIPGYCHVDPSSLPLFSSDYIKSFGQFEHMQAACAVLSRPDALPLFTPLLLIFATLVT
jgi:hypothetical protein